MIRHREEIRTPKNLKRVVDNITKLREELTNIERKVLFLRERVQSNQRKRINRKLIPHNVQYIPGNYVLVSDWDTKKKKNKSKLTLKGPYLIVDVIGENMYLIKNLMDEEQIAHSCRLKFYEGKSFKSQEIIKKVFILNGGRFPVEEVRGLKFINGKWNVLVKWQGFTDKMTTWEEYIVMKEDIPKLILNYAKIKVKDDPLLQELIDDLITKKKPMVKLVRFKEDIEYKSNLSNSKGWTKKEDLIFNQLVKIYGFSNWSIMIGTGRLPGKTKSQLVERARVLTGCTVFKNLKGYKGDLQLIGGNAKLPASVKGELELKSHSSIYIDTLNHNEVSKPNLSLHEIKNYIKLLREDRYVLNKKIDVLIQRKERYADNVLSLALPLPGQQQFHTTAGLPDSGATKSTISRIQIPNGVEMQELTVNGKNHEIITASGENVEVLGTCNLDVRLKLYGTCGEIHFNNLEFYVMGEDNWKHVLLGSEILGMVRLLPWQIIEDKMNRRQQPLAKSYDCSLIRIREESKNIIPTQVKAVYKIQYYLQDLIYRVETINEHLSSWQKALDNFTIDKELRREFMAKFKMEWKDLKETLRRRMEDHNINNPSIRSHADDFELRSLDNNIYSVRLGKDSPRFEIWIKPFKAELIPMDLTLNYWDELEKRNFDIILADPPWEIGNGAPTTGLTLNYSTLTDKQIMNMNIRKIQKKGFLFLWTVEGKTEVALNWIRKMNYIVVERIIWIKRNVSSNKIRQSMGRFLRRGKEICLMCRTKEKVNFAINRQRGMDIIESPIRAQSQKPQKLYELIEELFPESTYCELFGRMHNARRNWTTVGNELSTQEFLD